MVTLFFEKKYILQHYHHNSFFFIFLETLFRFSPLCGRHFKNVHFQKPNPTFKNFVSTNRYYQLLNLKKILELNLKVHFYFGITVSNTINMKLHN
jgi:hypothetical protein